MTLEDIMESIRPVSEMWEDRAKRRLDDLTKPRGSLGLLEVLAARYAAIREEIPISLPSKRVFVFVGDHGVVAEGVSAYPQEVTALMVKNFLSGGAGVNVLARCAGADVIVVDVGMKEEIDDDPGLIKKNIRRGAGNIAKGPAMRVEEAKAALEVGIHLAIKAAKEGVSMIGTGDMGIGNTTPSSALFAALLPADPIHVTGKGTGLDDEGLKEKIRIVRKALHINRTLLGDPLSTLASIGGLEIAAICGLCLGGAASRLAVVVDGFISTAAALVALRMKPIVTDYLFFAHQSCERGHKVFFEKEGLKPLLNLEMRLGEGTGSAIGMQIIEDAIRIFNEMATFSDVGIQPGS